MADTNIPEIIRHPENVITGVGSTARFTVAAESETDDALAYRWSVSQDGGLTWAEIVSGGAGSNLYIEASDMNDGSQYRCTVTNGNGTAVSNAALLTVVPGIRIITQPSDLFVLDGRITNISIEAEFDSAGGDGAYQLQKRTAPGGQWADVDNAAGASYSFAAIIDMDSAQYRFALTNDNSIIYSDVIMLTVLEDPVILQHPSSITAFDKGVAAFCVTSNASKADYNWQIRASANDEWLNIDDGLIAVNGMAQVELIARQALDGYQIRCEVGNALVTYTSDAATLTVSDEEDTSGIPINEYFFPDTAFRSLVAENYDTDEDGYLSVEEIDAVTGMTIGAENGSDIQDLGGVQYFTALDELSVQGTKIRSLRLGSLAFTNLTVTGNARLAALDISGCEQLAVMDCSDNNLEALDIENNAGLEKIDCHGNGITVLDLYKLTELTHLDCSENELTEINVGACALSQYVDEHEPVIDSVNGIIAYGSADGEAYLRCDMQTTIKNDMSVTITTPPSDANILVENEATFAVEADGERVQYQWQGRETDGEWGDIDGETDAALSITVSADMDRTEYRARVYNAYSSAYSDAALLRVYDYPVITTQPQDVVTIAGREITFVIETESNEDTYLWQALGQEDEEWVSAESVFDTASDVPILRITSELILSGYKLRCMVSNPAAETVSEEVSLLVLGDPRIITQPESTEVVFGTKHHFTVEAAGEMLSYQWMEKSQYDTIWENCVREGATTPTLIVLSEAGADLKQFRCVVSNGFQTITSNTVTLTMITLPVITANPHSVSAIEESSVSFAVSVTGRSMTFRWQIKENANAEWRDYEGDDSASYRIRFNASIEMNGFMYRCIISNNAGTVYSDEAELVISSSLFMLADAFDESAENILSAGEYTFSLNASKEGVTYSLGFGIYGDTTWLVENETKPFTFYADGIRPIRIILAAQRSESVSGCTIKPMLESGDTAHAWVSPAQKVHDIVNDFNYGWLSIGNTYNNVENVVTATLPCDVTIKYRPIWKDTI